jgi:hypothetical protein
LGAYTTLRCPSYCDARRRYRYIGLCYGPPGGGKMLPARYYVRSEFFEAYAPQGILAIPPSVSNSPRRIEWEVAGLRL